MALGFGFRLARTAAKVGCLGTCCTAGRFTWAWVQRTRSHYKKLERKRVSAEARACTHKRTAKMLTWMCRPTSAIGGKADMARTCQYVRLLPKADISALDLRQQW